MDRVFQLRFSEIPDESMPGLDITKLWAHLRLSNVRNFTKEMLLLEFDGVCADMRDLVEMHAETLLSGDPPADGAHLK